MSHTQWKAACRIVAKKLVNKNLALRKQLVGNFLKTIRVISQQSIGDSTFDDELYFHDTGYKDPALEEVIIDRKDGSVVTKVKSMIDDNEYSLKGTILAVDKNGRCYLELYSHRLKRENVT